MGDKHIARLWPELAQRANKDGWPGTRLLVAPLEHEVVERAKRRTERRRNESHLGPTKTLATFDFGAVPMPSTAYVTALSSRDA